MIRIAVIMGKMNSGGKKNLVMEYYRHIDRSKVQFDFICDSDSNAIPKNEIESMGGRVYIIAPYQHIFRNMREMFSILKKNNYQIVHSYNNTMNLFSMFVAKQAGVPIRINESISMGSDSGDWKNYLKKILKPFSHLFSTNYMANGEVCGRWQFGDKLFDEGKVKVFKTVIDVTKHKYEKGLREKTRQDFNITDNIVIGHIGRLTEQKNSLFMVDIFHEIVKREPKAKLLLVGDGNLRNQVLSRISEYNLKEKVIYLGRTEDIHKLYNAMDCFLLPSIYEGLPVVGVEAECCGLPIFFSTAVPKESSPCEDLGSFLSLKNSAEEWAIQILNKLQNLAERTDHSEIVKMAGFDSNEEGKKLQLYYQNLINS